LRKDISRLNAGRSLYLFATPILPSSLPPGALVPLTLAVGSYPTNCYTGPANNVFEPCYQDMQNQQGATSSMLLPEGKKVVLDAHAWENFPAFQPPSYQPPAWTRSPKTFTDASEFDTSSQIETVQAVPSGRIIHCSGLTLQQLLHVYPYQGSISQVLVDVRPQLDRPWTVLKLGGRVYLRGWIADHPARPLLPGRSLVIFSGPQVPDFVNPPVQITMPLDTLTWHVMMDGVSPSPDFSGTVGKVIVSIVRLDQHAWEKW
ncbi:MAG: hypothetical protein M3Y13_02895, partial [Armatimonadota bacterium]|nr:hypothetical protein [Armatimonadota bacterium]